MNIISRKTAACDKDPFDQSDRVPFTKNAGKGDAPRSVGRKFRDNYDQIDWGRKKRSKKSS